MISLMEYSAWLCWLLPIAASPLTFLVARKNARAVGWYASAIGLLSSAFAASLIPLVLANHQTPVVKSIPWIPTLNIEVGVLIDPLSVFMANIAGWVGLLILVYSNGYMAEEESQARYYFLMLLFIGGMMGLVMASQFLQLYIFWEIVGVCSYSLIGFWYHRRSAARAGMKAFVVTRVGDVFLLAGILLLYVNTGSFDFLSTKSFVQLNRDSFPILSIAVLMLIGAMGKSAQLPFHVWLPDAMEGPTPVSALIHAAAMVKAGIYLVSRVHILFSNLDVWLMTIAYVGGLTAVAAASMALVNLDVKKILAYSTISQLGLLMAALGMGTKLGWYASEFHLLSHALFKSLLFLSAGSIMHASSTTDVRCLGGLRKDMPITFGASLIGVLALAGIPPFNGFWSKELIIESTLNSQNLPVYLLITGASVLTVAYSIRWISLIFLGEKPGFLQGRRIHESPLVMTTPLVILATAVALSGGLGGMLEHYFGFEQLELNQGLAVPLTSVVIFLVGGIPAMLKYGFQRSEMDFDHTGPLTSTVQKIISNGYYFDHLYNIVFVRGLYGGFRKIFKLVEVRSLDRFNYLLSDLSVMSFDFLKRSQTGVLSYNLLMMVGAAIFFLLLIWWI